MCTLKRPMNTKTRKIPIVVHIETLNEHENEENSTKLCTLKYSMNTEKGISTKLYTLKYSMNTREREIAKEVHIKSYKFEDD